MDKTSLMTRITGPGPTALGRVASFPLEIMGPVKQR